MRGPIIHFKQHVGVFILFGFVALTAFLGFLRVGGGLPTGDQYELNVMMPTSASITPGSRVNMAGAKVGLIKEVERQGFATRVKVSIDEDSVVPVPEDSRSTLRQRTPIGENYLSIQPGRSSQMLPDGGTLVASQADEYVDVDQILSVLQGKTRDNARTMIQGLGSAIDGRGEQLNALLGGAARTLDSGAAVFTQFDRNRDRTAILIDQLGRLAASVGERGEAVRVTARRGLDALQAVAARDDALRATLDELPSTLRQVRETSGTLDGVAQTSTPIVQQLALGVRDVRPAVRSLRPGAAEGRRVLSELSGAAPRVETLLDRVQALSGPAADALPKLTKAACELAPMARYAKPYDLDIPMALLGLGSASNSYDASGHLIRLSPILGENSLAGAPKEVSEAANTLFRSGLFGKASPHLSWNPYPKANMIGRDQAGPQKNILGPQQLAASGYEYPRVQEDC